MTSCNFYQAKEKDVDEIFILLEKFKSDLVDLDYPTINKDKVKNFINLMLKKGKINIKGTRLDIEKEVIE